MKAKTSKSKSPKKTTDVAFFGFTDIKVEDSKVAKQAQKLGELAESDVAPRVDEFMEFEKQYKEVQRASRLIETRLKYLKSIRALVLALNEAVPPKSGFGADGKPEGRLAVFLSMLKETNTENREPSIIDGFRAVRAVSGYLEGSDTLSIDSETSVLDAEIGQLDAKAKMNLEVLSPFIGIRIKINGYLDSLRDELGSDFGNMDKTDAGGKSVAENLRSQLTDIRKSIREFYNTSKTLIEQQSRWKEHLPSRGLQKGYSEVESLAVQVLETVRGFNEGIIGGDSGVYNKLDNCIAKSWDIGVELRAVENVLCGMTQDDISSLDSQDFSEKVKNTFQSIERFVQEKVDVLGKDLVREFEIYMKFQAAAKKVRAFQVSSRSEKGFKESNWDDRLGGTFPPAHLMELEVEALNGLKDILELRAFAMSGEHSELWNRLTAIKAQIDQKKDSIDEEKRKAISKMSDVVKTRQRKNIVDEFIELAANLRRFVGLDDALGKGANLSKSYERYQLLSEAISLKMGELIVKTSEITPKDREVTRDLNNFHDIKKQIDFKAGTIKKQYERYRRASLTDAAMAALSPLEQLNSKLNQANLIELLKHGFDHMETTFKTSIGMLKTTEADLLSEIRNTKAVIPNTVTEEVRSLEEVKKSLIGKLRAPLTERGVLVFEVDGLLDYFSDNYREINNANACLERNAEFLSGGAKADATDHASVRIVQAGYDDLSNHKNQCVEAVADIIKGNEEIGKRLKRTKHKLQKEERNNAELEQSIRNAKTVEECFKIQEQLFQSQTAVNKDITELKKQKQQIEIDIESSIQRKMRTDDLVDMIDRSLEAFRPRASELAVQLNLEYVRIIGRIDKTRLKLREWAAGPNVSSRNPKTEEERRAFERKDKEFKENIEKTKILDLIKNLEEMRKKVLKGIQKAKIDTLKESGDLSVMCESDEGSKISLASMDRAGTLALDEIKNAIKTAQEFVESEKEKIRDCIFAFDDTRVLNVSKEKDLSYQTHDVWVDLSLRPRVDSRSNKVLRGAMDDIDKAREEYRSWYAVADPMMAEGLQEILNLEPDNGMNSLQIRESDAATRARNSSLFHDVVEREQSNLTRSSTRVNLSKSKRRSSERPHDTTRSSARVGLNNPKRSRSERLPGTTTNMDESLAERSRRSRAETAYYSPKNSPIFQDALEDSSTFQDALEDDSRGLTSGRDVNVSAEDSVSVSSVNNDGSRAPVHPEDAGSDAGSVFSIRTNRSDDNVSVRSDSNASMHSQSSSVPIYDLYPRSESGSIVSEYADHPLSDGSSVASSSARHIKERGMITVSRSKKREEFIFADLSREKVNVVDYLQRPENKSFYDSILKLNTELQDKVQQIREEAKVISKKDAKECETLIQELRENSNRLRGIPEKPQKNVKRRGNGKEAPPVEIDSITPKTSSKGINFSQQDRVKTVRARVQEVKMEYLADMMDINIAMTSQARYGEKGCDLVGMGELTMHLAESPIQGSTRRRRNLKRVVNVESTQDQIEDLGPSDYESEDGGSSREGSVAGAPSREGSRTSSVSELVNLTSPYTFDDTSSIASGRSGASSHFSNVSSVSSSEISLVEEDENMSERTYSSTSGDVIGRSAVREAKSISDKIKKAVAKDKKIAALKVPDVSIVPLIRTSMRGTWLAASRRTKLDQKLLMAFGDATGQFIDASAIYPIVNRRPLYPINRDDSAVATDCGADLQTVLSSALVWGGNDEVALGCSRAGNRVGVSSDAIFSVVDFLTPLNLCLQQNSDSSYMITKDQELPFSFGRIAYTQARDIACVAKHHPCVRELVGGGEGEEITTLTKEVKSPFPFNDQEFTLAKFANASPTSDIQEDEHELVNAHYLRHGFDTPTGLPVDANAPVPMLLDSAMFDMSLKGLPLSLTTIPGENRKDIAKAILDGRAVYHFEKNEINVFLDPRSAKNFTEKTTEGQGYSIIPKEIVHIRAKGGQMFVGNDGNQNFDTLEPSQIAFEDFEQLISEVRGLFTKIFYMKLDKSELKNLPKLKVDSLDTKFGTIIDSFDSLMRNVENEMVAALADRHLKGYIEDLIDYIETASSKITSLMSGVIGMENCSHAMKKGYMGYNARGVEVLINLLRRIHDHNFDPPDYSESEEGSERKGMRSSKVSEADKKKGLENFKKRFSVLQDLGRAMCGAAVCKNAMVLSGNDPLNILCEEGFEDFTADGYNAETNKAYRKSAALNLVSLTRDSMRANVESGLSISEDTRSGYLAYANAINGQGNFANFVENCVKERKGNTSYTEVEWLKKVRSDVTDFAKRAPAIKQSAFEILTLTPYVSINSLSEESLRKLGSLGMLGLVEFGSEKSKGVAPIRGIRVLSSFAAARDFNSGSDSRILDTGFNPEAKIGIPYNDGVGLFADLQTSLQFISQNQKLALAMKDRKRSQDGELSTEDTAFLADHERDRFANVYIAAKKGSSFSGFRLDRYCDFAQLPIPSFGEDEDRGFFSDFSSSYSYRNMSSHRSTMLEENENLVDDWNENLTNIVLLSEMCSTKRQSAFTAAEIANNKTAEWYAGKISAEKDRIDGIGKRSFASGGRVFKDMMEAIKEEEKQILGDNYRDARLSGEEFNELFTKSITEAEGIDSNKGMNSDAVVKMSGFSRIRGEEIRRIQYGQIGLSTEEPFLQQDKIQRDLTGISDQDIKDARLERIQRTKGERCATSQVSSIVLAKEALAGCCTILSHGDPMIGDSIPLKEEKVQVAEWKKVVGDGFSVVDFEEPSDLEYNIQSSLSGTRLTYLRELGELKYPKDLTKSNQVSLGSSDVDLDRILKSVEEDFQKLNQTFPKNKEDRYRLIQERATLAKRWLNLNNILTKRLFRELLVNCPRYVLKDMLSVRAASFICFNNTTIESIQKGDAGARISDGLDKEMAESNATKLWGKEWVEQNFAERSSEKEVWDYSFRKGVRNPFEEEDQKGASQVLLALRIPSDLHGDEASRITPLIGMADSTRNLKGREFGNFTDILNAPRRDEHALDFPSDGIDDRQKANTERVQEWLSQTNQEATRTATQRNLPSRHHTKSRERAGGTVRIDPNVLEALTNSRASTDILDVNGEAVRGAVGGVSEEDFTPAGEKKDFTSASTTGDYLRRENERRSGRDEHSRGRSSSISSV